MTAPQEAPHLVPQPEGLRGADRFEVPAGGERFEPIQDFAQSAVTPVAETTEAIPVPVVTQEGSQSPVTTVAPLQGPRSLETVLANLSQPRSQQDPITGADVLEQHVGTLDLAA